MPRTCKEGNCACISNAQLPETITQLRALTQVTDLGQDLESLALIGTQFENALVTTRNNSALISDTGGYGPLQTNDMPFRLNRRRITLRINRNASLNVARSAEDSARDLHASLVATDSTGSVFHRVQYTSAYDTCIANALDADTYFVPPAAPHIPLADNIVPLAAIRQARESWDAADAGTHLNDLLIDGGLQRRRCLPHIGKDRCWRVVPDVVASFLCFLSDQKRSFTRMVPAPGLVQAHVGSATEVSMMGEMFIARFGQSMFSLNCADIAEAWVSASGRYWQLELFDAQHKVIAVLAADPMSETGSWNDFLASLPRAA